MNVRLRGQSLFCSAPWDERVEDARLVIPSLRLWCSNSNGNCNCTCNCNHSNGNGNSNSKRNNGLAMTASLELGAASLVYAEVLYLVEQVFMVCRNGCAMYTITNIPKEPYIRST